MTILALLGLLGCGGECRTFHFHPDFPVEYRADVLEGVSKWNVISSKPISVESDSTNPRCAIRSTVDVQDYAELRDRAQSEFVAVWDPPKYQIVFAIDQVERESHPHGVARGLIIHEVGHSFGMKHLENEKGSVMYPEASTASEFTSADYAECRRVEACR